MFCCVLSLWYFRLGSELSPQRQLKEEAENVMLQLMNLVQYTAVSISKSPVHSIWSKIKLWIGWKYNTNTNTNLRRGVGGGEQSVMLMTKKLLIMHA